MSNPMRTLHLFLAVLLASLFAAPLPAQTRARLREITQVNGVRTNFLHGTGLVLGLAGTGDGTKASRQNLVNFLLRMGQNVTLSDVSSSSLALVTLTAELPPYARNGQRIDVTVSTAGDSTSLFGGTLLQAELLGPDRQVYALAQGSVSVGGFQASVQNARVQRGHTTVGRIPNGAIVETEVRPEIYNHKGEIELILLNPSWKTAQNVAAALNAALSAELTAAPSDHTVVRIKVPAESRTAERTVALLSKIGDVEVVPDLPSKVTINEKTGTIIVGEYVRVSPCVVAISELTIHVVDEEEVSQPQPGFNKGTTERVGRTRIDVNVGENQHVS